MDDIRNEHDIIENTDHFCGILLQVWSEGGRKDHFRAEFNAKTLAGIKSVTIPDLQGTRLNTVTGVELERAWDLFP
jgi:hypothetical protein